MSERSVVRMLDANYQGRFLLILVVLSMSTVACHSNQFALKGISASEFTAGAGEKPLVFLQRHELHLIGKHCPDVHSIILGSEDAYRVVLIAPQGGVRDILHLEAVEKPLIIGRPDQVSPFIQGYEDIYQVILVNESDDLRVVFGLRNDLAVLYGHEASF